MDFSQLYTVIALGETHKYTPIIFIGIFSNYILAKKCGRFT